jgi:hypothetical protein
LLIVDHYSEAMLIQLDRLKSKGKVSHFLFWSDDLHWHSSDHYFIKNKTFSVPYLNLITTVTQFSILYPHIKKNPIWIPHAASLRFQLPLNESAVQKVLVTGRSTRPWYIYREHALKLKKLGDKNIVSIMHPGYKPIVNSSFYTDYVKSIAQYSAGLTCGLILNYPVAKHFEIPAVGQLLLTNHELEPILKRLCLLPNIHYLPYTMESMSLVIQSAVDKNLYSRNMDIRRAARFIVMKMHTTEARSQLITRVALSLTQNHSVEGFYYNSSDALPIISKEYVSKLLTFATSPRNK